MVRSRPFEAFTVSRTRPLTIEQRQRELLRLAAWLHSDPHACLSFLDEHSAIGVVDELTAIEALENADGKNPERLLNFARTLSDREFANTLYFRVMRLKATQSPRTCLDMLSAFPRYLRPRLQREAVKIVIRLLGTDGLEYLLAAGSISASSFGQGAASISQSDAARAMELFEKHKPMLWDAPGAKAGRVNALLRNLAYENPDAALEWVGTIPPSGFAEQLRLEALQRKLVQNPLDTMAVLAEAGSANAKDALLHQCAVAFSSSNPEISKALIANISSERLRAQAYGETAMWVGGPDQAEKSAQFAAAIQNPLLRAQSFAILAQRWENWNPVGPLTFAVENMDDPVFYNFVSRDVKNRLNNSDSKVEKQRLSDLARLSPIVKDAIRRSTANQLSPLQKNTLAAIMR